MSEMVRKEVQPGNIVIIVCNNIIRGWYVVLGRKGYVIWMSFIFWHFCSLVFVILVINVIFCVITVIMESWVTWI